VDETERCFERGSARRRERDGGLHRRRRNPRTAKPHTRYRCRRSATLSSSRSPDVGRRHRGLGRHGDRTGSGAAGGTLYRGRLHTVLRRHSRRERRPDDIETLWDDEFGPREVHRPSERVDVLVMDPNFSRAGRLERRRHRADQIDRDAVLREQYHLSGLLVASGLRLPHDVRAFEKLAEVFQEQERYDEFETLHDEFSRNSRTSFPRAADLRPRSPYPQIADDSFLPYIVDESTSYKHLQDLGVEDALANSDVENFHNTRGSIDYETLLVDPSTSRFAPSSTSARRSSSRTSSNRCRPQRRAETDGRPERQRIQQTVPFYQGRSSTSSPLSGWPSNSTASRTTCSTRRRSATSSTATSGRALGRTPRGGARSGRPGSTRSVRIAQVRHATTTVVSKQVQQVDTIFCHETGGDFLVVVERTGSGCSARNSSSRKPAGPRPAKFRTQRWLERGSSPARRVRRTRPPVPSGSASPNRPRAPVGATFGRCSRGYQLGTRSRPSRTRR